MQVQLKQSEIEAAIKGYLARMGIPMTGRKVAISFIAGRQERGLIADMSIEDMELPEENLIPALPIVEEKPVAAPPKTIESLPAEPVIEPTPEPAKPKKTKLLAGLKSDTDIKEESDEAVTPKMAMLASNPSIFR